MSRPKLSLSLSSLSSRFSHSSQSSVSTRSSKSEHRPIDHQIKILIIGDSGVGKSCLNQRFFNNQFPADQVSTIGIDFTIKLLQINGQNIKVNSYDTSGCERYHKVTNAYCRDAHGVVVVYDTADGFSFFNVRKWMECIDTYAPNDVVTILVGNKTDSLDRQVSFQRGTEMAKEYDMLHFECSAKTGDGVEEAFRELMRKIIEIQTMESPDTSDAVTEHLNYNLNVETSDFVDVNSLKDSAERPRNAQRSKYSLSKISRRLPSKPSFDGLKSKMSASVNVLSRRKHREQDTISYHIPGDADQDIEVKVVPEERKSRRKFHKVSAVINRFRNKRNTKIQS